MGSTQVTPFGSYRGSSPAMDRRGLEPCAGFSGSVHSRGAAALQPPGGAGCGSVPGANAAGVAVAEQEARSRGCSPEDVKQVIFAVVAFLDESVLSSGNPVFANWPRLPLQAELFGHQLAGEIFFQELQKTLNRNDSQRNGRSAGGVLPVSAARFQRTLCGGRRLAVHHDRRSRRRSGECGVRRARYLRAERFPPTLCAWCNRIAGAEFWARWRLSLQALRWWIHRFQVHS